MVKYYTEVSFLIHKTCIYFIAILNPTRKYNATYRKVAI